MDRLFRVASAEDLCQCLSAALTLYMDLAPDAGPEEAESGSH